MIRSLCFVSNLRLLRVPRSLRKRTFLLVHRRWGTFREEVTSEAARIEEKRLFSQATFLEIFASHGSVARKLIFVVPLVRRRLTGYGF